MLNGKIANSMPNLLCTPESLVIIDFPRLADDLGLHWEVRGNKIRVNRNAVATYPTTRLQDIYAGMFVGKTDQLPYINTRLVADDGKLIGKSDLHITASVLC